MTVELSAEPGAEIRYTIDRTPPATSSTRYTGPLRFTATTNLRAQVFVGGAPLGEPADALYVATRIDATHDLPVMVLDSYGAALPPPSGFVRQLLVGLLTDYGSADIETGSSAIQLIGVRGAARVASQSGRITIDGSPTQEWALTTGSSNIEVTLDGAAAARLDAASRGEVRVRHPAFKGTSEKRKASGTIGPGGPPLRINSRSGQIHILSR